MSVLLLIPRALFMVAAFVCIVIPFTALFLLHQGISGLTQRVRRMFGAGRGAA
jgi:hypothetical protein